MIVPTEDAAMTNGILYVLTSDVDAARAVDDTRKPCPLRKALFEEFGAPTGDVTRHADGVQEGFSNVLFT